jgi:hypothetical protein
MSREAEMIDKHLSMLSEHFDTVQILCSRVGPNGGTETWTRGSGNILAREQHARDFVRRMAEQDRCHVRREMRQDEGDLGDCE